MKNFFTPKEVCALIGISYRKLQYWDKTGVLSPSHKRAGKYRLYTFADLLQAKVIQILRKTFSIQKLRKLLGELRNALRKAKFSIEEMCIYANHQGSFLVTPSKVIFGGTNKEEYVLISARELRTEVQQFVEKHSMERQAA